MSAQPLVLDAQKEARFRVRKPDDLLQSTFISDYLVKDLFPPETLSAIYGEPGSGKSFLALYIAYMLSMVWPVFGRRVRGVPVLYVALEGERGFEKRIRAAMQKWAASAGFYFITERADLFGGLGDTEAVIDAARSVEAEFIVIDTLARAMGAGSENESADMGRIIEAFDVIRRETKAHVCVVHHSGKDSARGMRGHSSLLAAVDTAIEVKKLETGERVMRVTKSKDDTDGAEIVFDLEVVQVGVDRDGDPITSCVVRESEGDPTPQKARVTGSAGTALDMLKRAIAESGEPAPAASRAPAGSRTIPVVLWRSYCDAGTVTKSDNPDSKRRTFVRAVETLQARKLIGIWNDIVWLT